MANRIDIDFKQEDYIKATKAAATTEQKSRIAELEKQVASFQATAKSS